MLRPLPGASHPEALAALETLSPYPYFERYRDQRTVVGAQQQRPSARVKELEDENADLQDQLDAIADIVGSDEDEDSDDSDDSDDDQD